MSEHYFAAEPSATEQTFSIRTHVWGHDLELVSAPGVFSSRRLDPGTSVLFRSAAPDPSASALLDLGCGYGAVACALALRVTQARVWAVDVNARARQLTATNAARMGVTGRVTVCSPDELPPTLSFDEVWSNPPIRIGKPALHEVLLRWLPRLRPSGRMLLVVGKHLGSDSLQRWLVGEGFQCIRVASAKGFRVLEVRQPDRLYGGQRPTTPAASSQ